MSQSSTVPLNHDQTNIDGTTSLQTHEFDGTGLDAREPAKTIVMFRYDPREPRLCAPQVAGH